MTDWTAIELGVKFRADSDGLITGLRFYKGAANTGTHIGHLWSAGGVRLAEATFSGESASGWQQVQLAQPVAITANTTYVASYWSGSGYFADSYNYFGAAVDNPPLHALSSGSSGGNGVYRYGASGFPSSSYQATNYWVDVVFTTAGGPADTTAPQITALSPASGASDVAVGASVTAQFDEPIDPSTITATNVNLRDSSGNTVAAGVSYTSGSLTARLTPQSPLDYSRTYTATVKGGTGGVTDTSGNALAENRTWSFTTAAAPPPPPDQGSGGPILVVHSAADGFGAYLPEILRTEGLNEFATTDLSTLSAAKLSDYQVVILGHAALSDAQVSTLTAWVQGGGKLIAMRPDGKLAALLGLTSNGGTLSDAYLRIDTGSAPGAGITAATMQFHGSADRYATVSGTRAVATLYSGSTTATTSPAVTLRSVGSAGGQAAAFTYDLGRSVVYTHQGNPAWAGQERDNAIDQGTPTIRSDDLFFGGSLPDYVDLAKVAIPQADEQQRLLANLITNMESDRLPVPRLWYFPNGYQAAIVMTGDQHPNGQPGTTFAFDRFIAQSPSPCSVVDWTCIRATSYVDPSGSPTLSAEKAKAYEDDGFEIALHLRIPGTHDCSNYSSYQDVKDALDSQLDGDEGYVGFLWVYRVLQPPATVRTHCIVWSDWDSEVRADLSRGIRLNADYYYWPSSWVAGRSGMFTGAGIPMRFAAMDGSLYDVYQATTQLPDETFETASEMGAAAATLLDGAVGPNGYYGFFTTNVHNDSADLAGRQTADAIVAAAKARGVPIISARQLLTWLDGRNGSSFRNLSFSNGRLHFTMAVGAGAPGLQAMLPKHGPSGDLFGITRDGQTVSFSSRTIKGVAYAMVAASTGDYEATYGIPAPDTTPPTITNVAAAPATDGTAAISWHTDEASTSRVQFGTSPASLTGDVIDGARVTDHGMSLTGLAAGTTYYYRVTSVDAAGNAATSPVTGSAPASFTVPVAPPADTTPPAITNVAAAPTTDGTAAISWHTDEASTSRVQFGTSPASLTGDVTDGARVTDHGMSLSGLAAGTTYYYRVTSVDAAGNAATSPVTGNAPASFTVPVAPPSAVSYSIFSSSAVPAEPAVTDWTAIELGVKFRADSDGLITGLRFYKGAANTGTHIGHLWSAGGVRLAEATFSGESASGWQQVQLAQPVAITANTTYVASYWSGSGYFADSYNYFGAAVDNPPLHALSSGSSGGNGVYRYGASGFPSSSYQATNYWVDVVFTTTDGTGGS